MIIGKANNKDYIRFGHGLFMIDFLKDNFPNQITNDRRVIEEANFNEYEVNDKANILEVKKFFKEEMLDEHGELTQDIKDLRTFFSDEKRFIICLEICPIAYLLYGTYDNMEQLPLEEALSKNIYSVVFASDQNTHYNSI